MRIIASCIRAVRTQLLVAGFAAPLLCRWLGDSPFAAEHLTWFSDPGSFTSPYWKITLAVCALVFVCGLAYGRLTRAPERAPRLRPAFLFWPALLMLAWAYALHDTGGNYHAETPAWELTRLLSQPPYQMLWLADQIWTAEPGALLQSEEIPFALRLLFPGEGPDFFANYGFFYQALFESRQGVGAGLFFQLALIAGIACTGVRTGKKLFRGVTCTLTPDGKAVPFSAGGRMFRKLPAFLALLCPALVLCWQIYAIESSLISSRPAWEQSNIVGGEPDPRLYTPYSSNTLLADLDGPSSLRIRDAYPRLDGATAFYPLYAAFFKAVYCPPPPKPGTARRSDEQSKAWRDSLQCSTTRKAYTRLIRGERDVVFAFEPSEKQLREAQEKGVKLRLIPLGKEAFVFLVHESNPLENLDIAQIQDIYTRTKTNWKDFGGPDKPIVAYQRPDDSGSQTIMLSRVMRGKKAAAPLREELIIDMGGIITQVAEYRNEEASIGYSFRWYATGMRRTSVSLAGPVGPENADKIQDLKLLAVEGIPPDPDRIADGSYPLSAPFYAVVRDEEHSVELRAFLNWLAGPECRELVAKTGYVPLGETDDPAKASRLPGQEE